MKPNLPPTEGPAGMSRRDFVTKSALLGASLAVAPALLAVCSGSPGNRPNEHAPIPLPTKTVMNTRKFRKTRSIRNGRGLHEHQRQLRPARR
jgi:hypothetical protein